MHPDSSGDFPGEWLDGTEWACAMEVTKETFVKTQQAAALVVVFCRWKGCGFSVDLKRELMYTIHLLYILYLLKLNGMQAKDLHRFRF